jgi:hypothetical protein
VKSLIASLVLLAALVPVSYAQDEGQPSEADSALFVPSTAVRRTDRLTEAYVVPASVDDVLAFYQASLPAQGWKIDQANSDPTGTKYPTDDNTRSFVFCSRPNNWRSVTFGDGPDPGSTNLYVSVLPDDDPC